MARADSWHLAEGDAITADLTALRLLGEGVGVRGLPGVRRDHVRTRGGEAVRPGQVADELSLGGLRREVEALGTVNHPVVVRGLRHDLMGARPHVVLEQIDGPRLSTLLRHHGPLPAQQYLPLAIDLASALHYLRRVGWTHLDIKPGNVIMGAPARLIDLSVARPLAAAGALRVAVGTGPYMAPEQCSPPRTGVPGHASDVWGLGVTLFEAVAGYRAFDDGDRDARRASTSGTPS